MNFYNLVFLLLLQYPFTSPDKEIPQTLAKGRAVTVSTVYKSADGGQSWQDISDGLPEIWQADEVQREGFFANDTSLYVCAGTGIYQHTSNSKTAVWNKDMFPERQVSIAPGHTGIFAFNYGGQFLRKTNGTKVWTPMFRNFQQRAVNTVFESAAGSVFIGSDDGLFRSPDGGKTWKQIPTEGWVNKLIESNGILMATSGVGILRSTDDGEHWERVLSEGGVGIAVEPVKGGFAAIVYNTKLEARTVKTTYDGGKTWQPIDTGLPPDMRTASIVQVGENFFCGHPDGIYRSSDKGKTWKLLLSAKDGKVFNLFVSGNVIYAVPSYAGC